MHPDRWLRPLRADSAAVTDLFLFPYSGAGVSLFSDWPQALPRSVNCWGVQLPGRQDRLQEEAALDLTSLLHDLVQILGPEVDERPYALFGHSMGSLLSYRLAVELPAAGYPAPVLLAVSGWSPIGFRRPVEAPLSHAAALEWLAATHGLPREVLAGPDALDSLVPPLIADLGVVSGYRDDDAHVDCPVLVFAGRDDPWWRRGRCRRGPSEPTATSAPACFPATTTSCTSIMTR